MIMIKNRIMQFIPEEIVGKICNNLNLKNVMKLKKSNKNIYDNIKHDLLTNLKIEYIETELKNFNKLKNCYTIRRNIVKLYNNSESLGMLEDYKNNPKIYDLEYHILIVINDIFHNLEAFKELFLIDKNIEYTKKEFLESILELIKRKLYKKSLEKQSEILREISLLLLKNR